MEDLSEIKQQPSDEIKEKVDATDKDQEKDKEEAEKSIIKNT